MWSQIICRKHFFFENGLHVQSGFQLNRGLFSTGSKGTLITAMFCHFITVRRVPADVSIRNRKIIDESLKKYVSSRKDASMNTVIILSNWPAIWLISAVKLVIILNNRWRWRRDCCNLDKKHFNWTIYILLISLFCQDSLP